ncbi:(deoxy)nucleoside triphosphate pyrophosphohydrolase [Aquimarina algiphila]|uniref:(deoxy)nucleoside triphosphate pyrophosphohydrolase n=1 Tax=Aquimarina algiphila TaxID=2047982 RepID=UPI00232ECFC6|nr:(deoxy)nucleoside triphosphate pyrophosphohydrolase [Aquimarina algiphila]
MIKVVCGIIYKDEKIFICRRKPSKSLGGFWEFPGGKIEHDETHEGSLTRELMEELEMEVEIQEFYDSSKYNYDQFSIELIAYICTYKSWNQNLTDHDKFEWVDPDKLLDWKLAPADVPLAKKIKEGKRH